MSSVFLDAHISDCFIIEINAINYPQLVTKPILDRIMTSLSVFIFFEVIRASVPRLELDAVFEQKNEIAKAVEEELEKVMFLINNEGSIANSLQVS